MIRDLSFQRSPSLHPFYTCSHLSLPFVYIISSSPRNPRLRQDDKHERENAYQLKPAVKIEYQSTEYFSNDLFDMQNTTINIKYIERISSYRPTIFLFCLPGEDQCPVIRGTSGKLANIIRDGFALTATFADSHAVINHTGLIQGLGDISNIFIRF